MVNDKLERSKDTERAEWEGFRYKDAIYIRSSNDSNERDINIEEVDVLLLRLRN